MSLNNKYSIIVSIQTFQIYISQIYKKGQELILNSDKDVMEWLQKPSFCLVIF